MNPCTGLNLLTKIVHKNYTLVFGAHRPTATGGLKNQGCSQYLHVLTTNFSRYRYSLFCTANIQYPIFPVTNRSRSNVFLLLTSYKESQEKQAQKGFPILKLFPACHPCSRWPRHNIYTMHSISQPIKRDNFIFNILLEGVLQHLFKECYTDWTENGKV